MTGFKHTVASFVFVFVCACCLWLCVFVSHYILAKRCVCTGLTVVRVRFQMKNCNKEVATATRYAPVRVANVTLRGRPPLPTQLAVFDRPDVVSNRLSYGTHYFERAELSTFATLLKPETVVLDIGANIGWWTFSFATTHAVHAFEPNPSNLAIQAVSRCMNPHLARRITVYPVGLYNREPARCEIYSHPRNLGNTHTLCGTTEEIATKVKAHEPLELRGSVEMRMLDTLVPEQLFRADKIVKLDVEGSEQVALMGATRLLTDGLPPRALFMEITFFKDTKRRELYRFLERQGYLPVRMVRYNLLFAHVERMPVTHMRQQPHGASPNVCDDYCGFHHPPECNVTCGLSRLQNCCDWWTRQP